MSKATVHHYEHGHLMQVIVFSQSEVKATIIIKVQNDTLYTKVSTVDSMEVSNFEILKELLRASQGICSHRQARTGAPRPTGRYHCARAAQFCGAV